MYIGYARVSTEDQNLEIQEQTLKQAGCKMLFKEKLSGANRQRPDLGKLLEQLREGDTVVVWKLDRLGRGVPQIEVRKPRASEFDSFRIDINAMQ